MSENILTLHDVAEYLRVHPSTVYRLIKRGELPRFKIGRDFRFNRESIDRWRNERERALRAQNDTGTAGAILQAK